MFAVGSAVAKLTAAVRMSQKEELERVDKSWALVLLFAAYDENEYHLLLYDSEFN